MKKEDQLQKLFVEINKKPKNLDHNIMQGIYKHVAMEKSGEEIKLKPWTWTYVLLGFISVAGLGYTVTLIDLKEESMLWYIGIAVLIPILIEKILVYKSIVKE